MLPSELLQKVGATLCADVDVEKHDRDIAVEDEVTRTVPLVLDHGRLAIALPALRGERGAGQQGGLVALMAVAFAAIVVARDRRSGGEPGVRGGTGVAHRLVLLAGLHTGR